MRQLAGRSVIPLVEHNKNTRVESVEVDGRENHPRAWKLRRNQGPAKALERAWLQAGRIDVTAQGRKVTVKRIAIATRWGNVSAGPSDALLSVRDPVDEGEPVDPKDQDAIFLGLLRLAPEKLPKPRKLTDDDADQFWNDI